MSKMPGGFLVDDIDFLIERVKIVIKYLTKKNK